MMGLRDLEALSWADEKGRELAAAHDRRSRLLGLSTWTVRLTPR